MPAIPSRSSKAQVSLGQETGISIPLPEQIGSDPPNADGLNPTPFVSVLQSSIKSLIEIRDTLNLLIEWNRRDRNELTTPLRQLASSADVIISSLAAETSERKSADAEEASARKAADTILENLIPDELTDLDTTVTGAELDTIKSQTDELYPLKPAEANATADQTGAEIVSAVDAELGSEDWKTRADAMTLVEGTTGTETAIRTISPSILYQIIVAIHNSLTAVTDNVVSGVNNVVSGANNVTITH